MIVKDDKQQKTLLEAGRRLRKVLDAVIERITVGVDAESLDAFANAMITDKGDIPAFLGYQPIGMAKKYPATLCVSVNNEVVHGIPKKEKVFKNGDVVSVDCGLQHKGVFVDAACTVMVGKGDTEAKALLNTNKKALRYALVYTRAGATTGDIGAAVETIAQEYGYATPFELGGHGLGNAPHEEPFIANIGNPGEGAVLQEGQVVAIEPIFFEGENPHITTADDGFTHKTASGKRSSHFEHTVIVTKGAPMVVTGPLW